MNKRTSLRPISGRRIDPLALVTTLCAAYGDRDYLETVRKGMEQNGIAQAVTGRDTPLIYAWLMECFNYQGVSDRAAAGYMATHGSVSFDSIERTIREGAANCPKLNSFDAFKDCGFEKWKSACNNPKAIRRCVVPGHDFRKGALNQAAYSLFLFIRDRAKGDLIGYIDDLLQRADIPGHPDRLAFMRRALIGNLQRIFGVSGKVISMTFADLLLGADANRARWVEVGGSMIAVDRLVHNFLRRSGIHHKTATVHEFGATCYGARGCAGTLDQAARAIDARQFNPAFPVYFPRFIQHSIWRFCAENELGICNGRNIPAGVRCIQHECRLYEMCGRVAIGG